MCLSTTFFKQHIFKHPFFTASNLVEHGRAPSAYLQDSMVLYGMDLAHLNFLSLTFEFGYIIDIFGCFIAHRDPRSLGWGIPRGFSCFLWNWPKLKHVLQPGWTWCRLLKHVETIWNHRCFLLRIGDIGVLNTIQYLNPFSASECVRHPRKSGTSPGSSSSSSWWNQPAPPPTSMGLEAPLAW